MHRCRCDELTLLEDAQADDYAEHLVRVRIAEGGRIVWFRCPRTKLQWAMEFVSEHDGPSMRLRRLLPAAELVERLAASGDRHEALAWTHPDVEFRIPGDETIHHGLEAARRIVEEAESDPAFPRSEPESVIGISDDEALVLGGVSFQREDASTERRPSGWLVALQDGRIARSLWFDSWEKARRAAGLPEGGLGLAP